MAIGKPVTAKTPDIDGKDIPDARLNRKPIERRVGQIHLTLALLGVPLHPANHSAEVMRFEWVDLDPAKLNPVKHFEPLRRF